MVAQDDIDPEQAKIVDAMILQAVSDVNYERVDLCLKKGADIDARNGQGRTPLMMAVWNENPSMVQYLLARRPSLFLKDSSNKTAFDLITDVRDAAKRQKITDILLSALPDHVRKRAASPQQVAALAEADAQAREKSMSDVTTSADITVSPPIVLPRRNPPKGFTL